MWGDGLPCVRHCVGQVVFVCIPFAWEYLSCRVGCRWSSDVAFCPRGCEKRWFIFVCPLHMRCRPDACHWGLHWFVVMYMCFNHVFVVVFLKFKSALRVLLFSHVVLFSYVVLFCSFFLFVSFECRELTTPLIVVDLIVASAACWFHWCWFHFRWHRGWWFIPMDILLTIYFNVSQLVVQIGIVCLSARLWSWRCAISWFVSFVFVRAPRVDYFIDCCWFHCCERCVITSLVLISCLMTPWFMIYSNGNFTHNTFNMPQLVCLDGQWPIKTMNRDINIPDLNLCWLVSECACFSVFFKDRCEVPRSDLDLEEGMLIVTGAFKYAFFLYYGLKTKLSRHSCILGQHESSVFLMDPNCCFTMWMIIQSLRAFRRAAFSNSTTFVNSHGQWSHEWIVITRN